MTIDYQLILLEEFQEWHSETSLRNWGHFPKNTSCEAKIVNGRWYWKGNSVEKLYTLQKNMVTPERNKKLQHLHKCMIRYGDIRGYDMQEMKKGIYDRHGIVSRVQLTDEQLEKEIEFFTSI